MDSKKKTVFVWNDRKIAIRYARSWEEAEMFALELRRTMHEKGSDDPRWQIVDGHLVVSLPAGLPGVTQ